MSKFNFYPIALFVEFINLFNFFVYDKFNIFDGVCTLVDKGNEITAVIKLCNCSFNSVKETVFENENMKNTSFIKDEWKNTEGDPMIKSKIRSAQMQMMQQKMMANSFTLSDYLDQMQQLTRMGDLQSMLGMLPGQLGRQLEG